MVGEIVSALLLLGLFYLGWRVVQNACCVKRSGRRLVSWVSSGFAPVLPRIVPGKLDIPAVRSLLTAEQSKLSKRRREKSAELLAAMAAEMFLEKCKQAGVNAICVQHSELMQKFPHCLFQSDDREIFERAIKGWLTSVGFSGEVKWNGGDWKVVASPRG